MTDVHPIAVTVTRLAQDYPLLLTMAGAVQATTAGTIGRQTNVHRVPGGVDHHDLRRETRDVLWGYAEIVGDREGLTDPASDDIAGNAARVAAHAATLDQAAPLGCKGHARAADDTGPRTHPSVEKHLACLAKRVRDKLNPPGAKVLVGLCPSPLVDNGATHSQLTCDQPLRANEGAVWCTNGHVHDTATVRDMAVAEASQRVHTLATIVQMAPTLWRKRVKYDALEKAIRSGRLPSTRDPQGRHLVRVPDVAAIVIHGR